MVSLSLENFGNFWSFLGPKENHCSSPSNRIRGFKTRKFSEENWKKVLDVEWICVALVEWIRVPALVNSVGSVKGEEILWILQKKSVET